MKDPEKVPLSDMFVNQMISMYEKSVYMMMIESEPT